MLKLARFRTPAQHRQVTRYLDDGQQLKHTLACPLSPPFFAAHLADLGHDLLVSKRASFGQSEGHAKKLLGFSLAPKREGLDTVVESEHARRLRMLVRKLAPALCHPSCQGIWRRGDSHTQVRLAPRHQIAHL